MQVRGIDRTIIKWIAMITMLIDHIGYALIPNTTPVLNGVSIACNTIGRCAFPLFLFLLADGFLRTRSKPKFFIRLLVMAIVSEVPFDLVKYHNWINIRGQNVFWTLLIFFAYMWVSELLVASAKDHGLPATNKWTILLHVIAGIFGFCAGCILLTDYLGAGVVAGIFMYHFLVVAKEHPTIKNVPTQVIGYVLGIGFLALSFVNPIYALPTVLLVWNYHGKCFIKMPKWIGYAFYPAHLSVIALVLFLEGKLFPV